MNFCRQSLYQFVVLNKKSKSLSGFRMSNEVVEWPKIVLFGDSLTQHSFDPVEGRWGALLANKLQRICDVVCRGFSGYNSTYCRMILPELFSTKNVFDIKAFVILLGSNDCSGAGSVQHVPLEEYKGNLESIIKYLQKIGISEEKIILMTPPPYSDDKYSKFCEETGRVKTTRDLKVVAQYASSCVDVANKYNIEVINLYEEMIKYENWPDYFDDGLHFGQQGSTLVYSLLWPLIEKRVYINKMIFPYWRDFDVNKYKKSR